MKTVGLVSCGSRKLTCKAPARSLYTSALFKMSAAYAAASYDQWFILSAKHGLLSPDVEVEPYEHRLTRAEAGDWARAVVDKLRGAAPDAAVFVLAGEDYVAPLASLMEVFVPLDGLQIGERLAWLKRQLA